MLLPGTVTRARAGPGHAEKGLIGWNFMIVSAPIAHLCFSELTAPSLPQSRESPKPREAEPWPVPSTASSHIVGT